MEEQLISFRTALLAKEKGVFKDEVIEYYSEDYKEECCSGVRSFPKCTQSLLQKWLREKHNQLVYVEHSNGWWDFVVENSVGYVEGDNAPDEWSDGMTYEEALEAGLYEALKLL